MVQLLKLRLNISELCKSELLHKQLEQLLLKQLLQQRMGLILLRRTKLSLDRRKTTLLANEKSARLELKLRLNIGARYAARPGLALLGCLMRRI